jgi:glycosyltransferase involved in cell wall biosynthesis
MDPKKALFLTNKKLLYSEITGGVQLCSQEFHYILENLDDVELTDYYVPFTKAIKQRLQIRLGFENYSMYNVAKDKTALLNYIESSKISIVFINMSSAVRYALPIKETYGDKVKVILLSHGNHSGDFLHLITKPIKGKSAIGRTLQKIRLGNLIATESIFRTKYLDGVITISETERQIENWFGAHKVSFLPRRLHPAFLFHSPVQGRVGFIGRLDHPPNLQGIKILLDQLKKADNNHIEIRLVGAPTVDGNKLAETFKFVKYLGELSDMDVEKEVSTWAFFLNPVWWYSTGASTKLAKAISWGIPIITTTAGMRGYEWKKGSLLVADSPAQMIDRIVSESSDMEKIKYWAMQTKIVAENGLTLDELKDKITLVL